MRYAILFFALFGAACDSPVDDGIVAVDMRGTWLYSALQESPALSIEGTLNIDQQSGREFSGTAAFSEMDIQGTITNRAGQLSGRVVGPDAVDFDIFFSNEPPRRHVSEVRGDSMIGNWARTDVFPPMAGSYSSRRHR